MTAQELIKTYNIQEGTGARKGGILIANVQRAQRDRVIDEIKARKAEILQWFADERAAMTTRQAKIDAIPGLKKIEDAIEDMAKWRAEFNASFDDVGGLSVRPMPQYDIDAMKAEYPQAAAYLAAEEYAVKENYELSTIGKAALEAVINGDYENAIAEMERKVNEFTKRHLWD